MATLMDWLMQTQARGYGSRPSAPSPLAPTEAVREQMLKQTGAIPDTGAYSQLQSYVGGQDSPIEQLRMRGQAAMPAPSAPVAAPVLPSMMGFSPNQFGGLTAPAAALAAAPSVAPPIPQPVVRPPAAPSIFSRIFSGEDYQSNSMPVVMAPQGPDMTGAPLPQTVNWGNPESAADFFRAAAAAQRIGLL